MHKFGDILEVNYPIFNHKKNEYEYTKVKGMYCGYITNNCISIEFNLKDIFPLVYLFDTTKRLIVEPKDIIS